MRARSEFREIEIANDNRGGTYNKTLRRYNLANNQERRQIADEAKRYISTYRKSSDSRVLGKIDGYQDFLEAIKG